jgi:hypothetical protein
VTEMALIVMALVDPSGQVVNKIVVDTEKPFTLPPGWSMHEWNEAKDGSAYQQYIAGRQTTKKPGLLARLRAKLKSGA